MPVTPVSPTLPGSPLQGSYLASTVELEEAAILPLITDVSFRIPVQAVPVTLTGLGPSGGFFPGHYPGLIFVKPPKHKPRPF